MGRQGQRQEDALRWFGYLVHLIVDARYELPVAFAVTPASYGEQPVAQLLLDQLQERHPDLLETCERLSADKATRATTTAS